MAMINPFSSSFNLSMQRPMKYLSRMCSLPYQEYINPSLWTLSIIRWAYLSHDSSFQSFNVNWHSIAFTYMISASGIAAVVAAFQLFDFVFCIWCRYIIIIIKQFQSFDKVVQFGIRFHCMKSFDLWPSEFRCKSFIHDIDNISMFTTAESFAFWDNYRFLRFFVFILYNVFILSS